MDDVSSFPPDLRAHLLSKKRDLERLLLEVRQLLDVSPTDRLSAATEAPLMPQSAPASPTHFEQTAASAPAVVAPKPEHAPRPATVAENTDYQAHPQNDAVQASQAIRHEGPIDTSLVGHALLVTSAKKFFASTVDGIASAHAGIQSNWPQFLRVGHGGLMGPGSCITVLAERDGDILRILGTMPYAGLSWGKVPATRLRGRADGYQRLAMPLELSMAALRMRNAPRSRSESLALKNNVFRIWNPS